SCVHMTELTALTALFGAVKPRALPFFLHKPRQERRLIAHDASLAATARLSSLSAPLSLSEHVAYQKSAPISACISSYGLAMRGRYLHKRITKGTYTEPVPLDAWIVAFLDRARHPAA